MEEKKEERTHKANSTSTLYVKNTPSNPNTSDLIESLAKAMKFMIDENIKKGYKNDTIEDFYLHKYNQEKVENPSIGEIGIIIHRIYKIGKLASETLVMTLVYLERLEKKSNIKVSIQNWKLLLLQGMILASKVWEDLAVWNRDFRTIFHVIPVTELNKMERVFLNIISFNVAVDASSYALYYFKLRDLSDAGDAFSLPPLTQQMAQELENRSLGIEYTQKKGRSQSELNGLQDKSPLVILN